MWLELRERHRRKFSWIEPEVAHETKTTRFGKSKKIAEVEAPIRSFEETV